MAMSDPFADMLTRMRNACMVKFDSVDIPLSNLKADVARLLKEEGYISDFHILKDDTQGVLRIDLKYDQHHQKVINGLRRISKPGCRVYVKSDRIPKVMSGLGIAIISTSKGVMTDHQARKMRVGGEFLCEVW